MSKGEYLIVPKGTKFMGSGKLGLTKYLIGLFNGVAFFLTIQMIHCSLHRVKGWLDIATPDVKNMDQIASSVLSKVNL